MQLTRFDDSDAFLCDAEPELARDEVIHALLLGVARRAGDHTEPGAQPYLATVRSGNALLLAAVRTPPHRLLLSSVSGDRDDAIAPLVDDLRAGPLPGVTGPVAAAEAFATAWQQQRPVTVRRGMDLMVFQLRQVTPPEGVSGAGRWATADDLDLLTEWADAFNRECHQEPRPPLDRVRSTMETKISRGEMMVWDDEGQAVCMAGRTRGTAQGESISYVRTPAAFRRRGYASALVAALSQWILDSGKRYSSLFTDRANPTSNHIYQQIGYEPRGAFVELHFEDGRATG